MKFEELLKNYKFTPNQVSKITKAHARSGDITLSKKFIDKVLYFRKKEYTEEEIRKITYMYPDVILLEETNLDNHYSFFNVFQFKKQQIDKVIKTFPSFFSISENNFKNKIEYFTKKNYTKEEIAKMFLKLPSLFSHDEQKYDSIYSFFDNKGYSKEQTKHITITFTSVFSYGSKTLQTKYDAIKNCDYEDKEIIEITSSLPSIYGSSTSLIKEKLKFYNSLGLKEAILHKPTNLIQSIELSYARYNFFLDNNMLITDDNRYLLFVGNEIFERRFNITKEELLNNYPYNEEERGRQR